jgi:hypothetical protein
MIVHHIEERLSDGVLLTLLSYSKMKPFLIGLLSTPNSPTWTWRSLSVSFSVIVFGDQVRATNLAQNSTSPRLQHFGVDDIPHMVRQSRSCLYQLSTSSTDLLANKWKRLEELRIRSHHVSIRSYLCFPGSDSLWIVMAFQQNRHTQDRKLAGAPWCTNIWQFIPLGQAPCSQLCKAGQNLWRRVSSQTWK